jgi:hypothetical protein
MSAAMVIPFPGAGPAGGLLHVGAGVGQGGREYPEHLGAVSGRGHAESVLGAGREGEGVTLFEADLLPGDGDLQLASERELQAIDVAAETAATAGPGHTDAQAPRDGD